MVVESKLIEIYQIYCHQDSKLDDSKHSKGEGGFSDFLKITPGNIV